MIQAWILVAPFSKIYTVSTVLFHKYGGANVRVKNWMSHFSMFVPTKVNVKLVMKKRNTPKKLGLSYVSPLTYPLYLQQDQFITVQVHPYNSIS